MCCTHLPCRKLFDQSCDFDVFVVLELTEVVLEVLVLLRQVVVQPLFLPDNQLRGFELAVRVCLADLVDELEVPSCDRLPSLAGFAYRLDVVDNSLDVLHTQLVQGH